MTIGTFGDIAFEVSSSTVQTFDSMKWGSSAKYATHALHGKTGILELTGFDPDEVEFDMFLSAFLGVSPDDVLKALDRMLRDGKVSSLVIGTSVIGKKWVITKVSKAFKHVYRDGTLVSCQVSVSIKQYE